MDKEPLEVSIRKPLYGTFCYINETVLRKAVRESRLVRVTVPQGSGLINPAEVIKSGKRMEKVFKRPDQPMILFGVEVQIQKADELGI